MFGIEFVLLAERCMLGSVSDTLGVAATLWLFMS
jgi:hypothetical protein